MITRIYSILIFTLCAAATHVEANTRPNLIVILSDDQGYHDVGFNGSPDIVTPHLDRLATDGVRFTDGYVTFPVCGPSRAGLLTGRYQDRFGFTNNPSIDPENPISGLPLEEETLGTVLRKVGYKNAIIGKWHMGTHPNFHPHNRGFDHFYGFLAGGLDYISRGPRLNSLSEVTRMWQWYRMRVEEDGKIIDSEEYLTDELSDAAVRFIEKEAQTEDPFFLYLAYNAPHSPLQATQKYMQRFAHIEDPDRRTFAAMVSAMDDGVGRVMESLRRNNIEEDTLIFFLSDNGATNKFAGNNGELRGWKGSLFEGGLRVPFAMQWKGTIPAGQTFEHPVISLDIFATIAEITGVAIAEERPLDGKNLIPHVTGENTNPPHETLFWSKRDFGGFAMRHGSTKMVAPSRYQEKSPKLYNLDSDISEQVDLSQQNPEQTENLLKLWHEWDAKNKDRPFPTLMEDKWFER